MLPINFLSIIVAAIVAFVVGFLMHGPVAGKLWMRLANIVPTGNEKFSDMVPQMLWNLLANVVTATVLSVVYLFASHSVYLGAVGLMGGVICALWLWVFGVAGSSMDVIWMGKSGKLWLFECFSSLLVMVSMGAVIAAW